VSSDTAAGAQCQMFNLSNTAKLAGHLYPQWSAVVLFHAIFVFFLYCSLCFPVFFSWLDYRKSCRWISV